MFYPSEKLF